MRVSVITTGEGDYSIPVEALQYIDNLVFVKDWDVEGIIKHALDMHLEVPLSGVVAGEEFRVDETAHIAGVLDLAGVKPDMVEGGRNKAIMRARLAAAGIRVPNFAAASTLEDVIEAGARIGFPCVIKPTNLLGSVGVCRVNNSNELVRAYQEALNKENHLESYPSCVEVVIEDLLIGTEYSVDGYVTSRRIEVIAASEVRLGQEPHFQEVGHLAYRMEDLPFHRSLAAYIRSVVKTLGIVAGPFHSEIMMTKEGPVLIEIAARLAGGHLPELVEKVTGISIANAVLATLIGSEIPAPARPQSRVAVIQYITNSALAGLSYRELQGWDEVLSLPGVFHSDVAILPGKTIPLQEDYRSRIAYVMYLAESRAQAQQMWEQIERKVTIVA